MNLAFLLPAGLAALAAVLLPLLIHLARRSEQRPTVFAALRWLQEKPKPRHRIRFDEWLLLLVRVVLVALVGLLLAKPVLFGAASHAPYVVVAPGVDDGTARQVAVAKDARWRFVKASDGAFTSVLREIDATLPPDVTLTVIVPTQLDGVDAQIPHLTRKVDWRVVQSPSPPGRGVGERATPPTPLTIRHTPNHDQAARYLRAATIAWKSNPDIAPTTQPIGSKATNVAWLATGAVPADLLEWTRTGGTLLLDSQATIADMPVLVPLWRDGNGDVLIEGASFGRGRLLRFTRPLVPAEMPVLLDGDFPRQLRTVLEPATALPARVFAANHAPTTGAAAYPPAARDIAQWLVLLIALVFALERWLATARRSGVAP